MKLRASIPLLLLAASSVLCAAQTYTVTDLGTLPGGHSSGAKSINATGQITGFAYSTNDTISNVFRFEGGTLVNLGTLGGSAAIGNGINAAGQVAGYSTNSVPTYRAFISVGDSLVDIGDLGGGSAVAYAINDAGQVVGASYMPNGEVHPFLYNSNNGKMTDLGTLGSHQADWWNSAQSINKSGVVVGTSYDADGNFFGFRWANGKIQKLGTLGGLWSQAYAINNKGQITGVAYTKNGGAHAFIGNGTTMKDLGTFAGATSTTWGFGINNNGVIVGQSTFQNTYHAFVYSGGKIKDLNKLIPAGSGWTLLSADGINDAGVIVGMGLHNGQEHAYQLTPQ